MGLGSPSGGRDPSGESGALPHHPVPAGGRLGDVRAAPPGPGTDGVSEASAAAALPATGEPGEGSRGTCPGAVPPPLGLSFLPWGTWGCPSSLGTHPCVSPLPWGTSLDFPHPLGLSPGVTQPLSLPQTPVPPPCCHGCQGGTEGMGAGAGGPQGDIPPCPQRKPTCLACYKFDTSDVPKVLDKYHNCGPSHHLAAKVRCPQCPRCPRCPQCTPRALGVSPVSPPGASPCCATGDPAAGRSRVPGSGGGRERGGRAVPARNVRLLPGTASLGGYGDTPGDTPAWGWTAPCDGDRGHRDLITASHSVSSFQAPRHQWTLPQPPLLVTTQHRVTEEGPGRVPPSRLSPLPSKPSAGSAVTALIPIWHRPCHPPPVVPRGERQGHDGGGLSSGETTEAAGQRDTRGWDMFNAQCHHVPCPQDVPQQRLGSHGSSGVPWGSCAGLWWLWGSHSDTVGFGGFPGSIFGVPWLRKRSSWAVMALRVS